MRALILHDAVAADASLDAADALAQAALFERCLGRAGHEVATVPVGLDLRGLHAEIGASDLIVNLVESLGGRGSLIHLVPALVESIGAPMTGCPARAIAETSNKIDAKRIMSLHGVATPPWIASDGGDAGDAGRGTWIVKSVWEHASIGLGPSSIVEADGDEIREIVESSHAALGGLAFAERFIDGREFNVSLVEVEGEPTALPLAEIRFVDYGDRPRIVDYAAKWSVGSFEYENTPRCFEFGDEDGALASEIVSIARRCWRAFGLRGYARVDFRVDHAGAPWALEVNANPCVAEDAGFMAAAHRAGLSADDVVDLLVRAAISGRGRRSPQRAR